MKVMSVEETVELLRKRAMVGRMEVRDKQLMLEAADRLEELYGEYCKQNEWISVDERLPDNHRAVLVVCKGTTIGCGTLRTIGSYGGGFWSLADADGTMYLTKYMHFIVTHWMELPEPPKM